MEPFYDPTKSYEQNYTEGPFGDFANGKVYHDEGEPRYDFLGHKVYLPFGIPAGPLLNSKFIKGAFDKGFDLCVYKTVRSDEYPCHPFPNVLAVHTGKKLTFKQAQEKPLIADAKYKTPISITNSFGVPSRHAKIWQADARKAISYEKKGQVMILSCMGTVREGQNQNDFIDDYIKSAKLAIATKPKAIEINLSCPNIGNEGLVCYNLDITEKISAGVSAVLRGIPLILKVGYYKDDKQLAELTQIASKYAQCISAINTIQATVVDKKGNQALPGKMRLRSGICGASIKWAGLEMVKKLVIARKKTKGDFAICGVGGVMAPADYRQYRKAGADAVMSATGAMWNPRLAIEIKKNNERF